MGPEAPITESSGNVSFNGDGGALTYTNQPHSHYLQRPGLTTVTVGANTYLLAGFSSSCDAPTPYYGWLVSMNVTNPVNGYTNGMSPAGVYCSTCSAQTNGDAAGYPGGTIWQSGAAPAVDGVNVFVETANGNYDAGSALSDSLVRLTVQSDGSLTVSDYFTPSNEVALAQYDYDLGSASPMILPGSMVLAGSKTGTLYLTNELALGGYQQGPSGSDNVLSEVQASCPQTTGWTPSTNCFNVQLAVDATPDGNWAQLHGAGVFWAEQNYAYYEGQWDTLRRVPIDLLNKTIGTGADAGVGDLVYQPYANYPGVTALSLSVPSQSPSANGILWGNRLYRDISTQQNYGSNRTDLANAGFPDAGDYRTPEGLSSSELWYGYFVAVDATLMTKLYEDTDKFIGAKFTAPEIYNGRVYLPTFSGEIRTYGYDTDGDGVPDTMDNCPTVSNADQANANEDAERILAGAGMPVLLGDACDPNATTSFSSLGPTTDGVQVPCTQMLIGCSSSTSTQTTCTRQFNTNLTFSAHIGNDTGTASPASGTTGPAFCPCQFTNQYLCLQSSQGGCPGGNDSHFPALDGGAFTDWKSISQLAPDGSAQWFSPLNLTHVEPPNLVASSTFATGWDYPYDVSRLGGANSDAGLCDAGLCGLQGELWSHVMTFTPNNDAGENALVPNLNNSYRAATAQYLPPQYPPSLQPCTIPQYQPWLWGQIFWGQQGWAQDPTWLYPLSSGVTVQSGSFASDATSSFTQNALSVLEPLTGGSSPSFLLMSDGARSLGTTNVLGAVMTPIAGTTNVMLADALVANGNQVDVVTAISGATQNVVSYGVIEALDPETGKLYALTQNGSTETLVTLDAVHALNNWLYAQTSVALSGTAFSTPLAMQYSDANGKLYLLDQVPSAGYALRLSSITTGGVMTELWRTRSVDRLPAAFLSATPQGTLVVSIQSGTSYNDAMVVDGNGVPLASYNNPNSGMRTRALLGTGGGLWFPVETTSPASGRITLTPAFQPRLVSGICGTTWFKSEAGSTGILATAAAACNPITNGGFETGTLLDWTTSGASVTISTSAHSGSFSAMLGSTSPTNGDSTVQQTFVVPGTGGTLTLWYKNVCPDTVYYDWFIATLQNTSGQTLATIVPKTCTALGSWTQATLNLASWAGQSVVVVMTSHDDNYPSDPTYSFVDDIGVQ